MGAQRKVMDGYAHQPEYSGLTLSMLTHALNRWTFDDAAAPPAAERTLFSDPVGSGLINVRRDGAWASFLARGTGPDARSAQGLRALKVRHGRSWVDLLGVPARDRLYASDTGWTLKGRSGAMTAALHEAVMTRSGVRLRGSWGGGTALQARLVLDQNQPEMRILVPARTRLEHRYWPTPVALLRAPGSSLHRRPCVVTASGRACPVTLRSRNRSAKARWFRVSFERR